MNEPDMMGQEELSEKDKENMVRVDGFRQVLEMLQVADRDFRESLLARIAQRDNYLAQTLRKNLERQGLY